jgi:myo-inositol-1(or 4)-monophosphatase
MLEKILDFAKNAGNYAKANQANVDFASSKKKSAGAHDVVTETDLEISRRFKKFVKKEFSDLDYVIVDEETFADLGAAPMQEIKRHEYAFVIDPIDGTLTYANGLPYYGVMIGVFRRGGAVASVVYAPSLNLLVYADEQNAYVEENDVRRKLEKLSETAALYANDSILLKEDAEQEKKMNVFPLDTYAGAVDGIYVAIGKLRSWTWSYSLWDIAGLYGVFAQTGVEIFDPATDQPIDLFDEKLYDDKLFIKEPKIICLPKYYQDFKKLYKL